MVQSGAEPGAGRLEAPGGAVDLAALDRLLAEVGAWLDDTALLGDEVQCESFRRRLQAIRERRAELLSPLQVVLIGGTGVGKSSLLNALAGEPIAQVSPRRPCTQKVLVYHHEADGVALDPDLAPPDQRVAHRRPELRDKVLVDTPDYDSIDPEHRRRMQAALEGADVVLFVTTAEKYADLAGAQWLARYRDGRRFVFVLNRADEGLPTEVSRDAGRKLDELGFAGAALLVTSATDALARKQGLGEGGAEFERLERLLAEELDAKRIRAIKEGNLEELVRRLLGHVLEAVPADIAKRLGAWRDAGETAYGELRGELSERLYPALVASPRLMRHVEYWFGTSFGGPVGALLTLVYGLRSAFSPVYPRLWELSDAPDLSLVATEEEADAVAARAATVCARLRALAVDSGLPGGAAGLGEPGTVVSRGVAQRLDDRLRDGVGREIRQARTGRVLGQRLLSLVLNVPVLAALIGLPVYFVYDRLGALWGDRVLQTGPFFQAAAIVVLLWLWFAAWVGQSVIRRRATRFVGSLRQVVEQAVDEVFRGRLMGRLDDHLETLRGQREALAGLVERAASLRATRRIAV